MDQRVFYPFRVLYKMTCYHYKWSEWEVDLPLLMSHSRCLNYCCYSMHWQHFPSSVCLCRQFHRELAVPSSGPRSMPHWTWHCPSLLHWQQTAWSPTLADRRTGRCQGRSVTSTPSVAPCSSACLSRTRPTLHLHCPALQTQWMGQCGFTSVTV